MKTLAGMFWYLVLFLWFSLWSLASVGAYGASHMGHGVNPYGHGAVHMGHGGYGHHGESKHGKHGKFKHGKFKHGKHEMSGGKFKKWK